MARNRFNNRIRVEVRGHYTEISQADALRQLTRMREYQQLRQFIGNHINEVVASFDDYVQRNLGHGLHHPTNPGLHINFSERYGAENELDMYREMLRNERNVFLRVRNEISTLWQLATAGRLAPRLQQEQRTPDQYGAAATDSDMDKAIKWAFSPNDQNPDPVVEHNIRQTLNHVIQHLDVRDMATADYLFANLVNPNTVPANRRHHVNTGYCSTGGGRALQDGAEVLSQGFAMQPNDGVAQWDDLACFLFGAHVRAQAYSDGNKRVSRGLYAVTLLQGGRPFLAPALSLDATTMGPHFIRG
jgi:hypothetical protein